MKRKVGIFQTAEQAIEAVRELQNLGFTNEEISIITKDEKMKDYADDEQLGDDSDSIPAKSAVTGGVVGGLGALLIELGLIAIPGIGPFLAVGPVGAGLIGAMTGGAVGGLVGALVDMGFDQDEAIVYDEQIRQGKILICVDDHIDRTLDLDRVLHPYPAAGAAQQEQVEQDEPLKRDDL